MKTRELTKVAFLASLLMIGYLLCYNILYVEVVTFLTLLYGCTQRRKIAMMACFCFGLLVLLIFGIFPWSLMYCVIFPFVTFLTLLYGCTQRRKIAMMACFCFGLLVLLIFGIFPWSLMYCVIFPCYAWLASYLKKWLLKGEVACIFISFIFAFLLGQLIDLPYWLFSGKLTLLYMAAGLKASLIQGLICAIESACFFRSFLLGQLIDLPYWLFSGKLTLLYMAAGLKASLIQGLICAIESACFFRSVSQRVLKMEGIK